MIGTRNKLREITANPVVFTSCFKSQRLQNLLDLLNSEESCRVTFAVLRQFLLKIHNLLNLHEKPPVNLREVENLLDSEAGAQGVADEEDAFGVGHAQLCG